MHYDWDMLDKFTTGFTCELLPLVSNYSRAVLDLHSHMCKYLYLHSNTRVFLVHSRTSQELSVKCVEACRRAQVFFTNV